MYRKVSTALSDQIKLNAVKFLFLLLFNLHNKGMNTYFDICCVIMFFH